jgi:tetratricopeptide (TPR) repeat protein
MADIFISYSRDSRALVEKLAANLIRCGYSVWWDTDLVGGGNYRDAILKRLSDAKVVIVVWTLQSVVSEWVISEAERARAQRKLIPIKISSVKPNDIPPPFDVLHTEEFDDFERIMRALTHAGLSGTDKASNQISDAAAAHFANGRQHFWAGKFSLAIEECTKAIELDSRHVEAFIIRGDAYNRLAEFGRAIQDFDAAIRCDDRHPVALERRANAYLALGRADRAIEDCDRSITLNSTHADPYVIRANAHNMMDQFERAIADCDWALQRSPSRPEYNCQADAYVTRAIAQNALRRFHSAVADCARAIELAPMHPNAYATRAIANNSLGHFDKTIADADTAIQLNPRLDLAYHIRGVANSWIGQLDRAATDYRMALQINPSNNAARMELQKLGMPV